MRRAPGCPPQGPLHGPTLNSSPSPGGPDGDSSPRSCDVPPAPPAGPMQERLPAAPLPPAASCTPATWAPSSVKTLKLPFKTVLAHSQPYVKFLFGLKCIGIQMTILMLSIMTFS